ncbi:MAG: hypothetical protein KDL31_10700, partial [Kiritimatiellae bacterium]|nr:hypothetical protein [Kiritimatiellia bacterium]
HTENEVTLIRDDGETIRMKRADLSDSDQAYLDQLASGQDRGPEPEPQSMILTDIQIPFGRMVMIILKWSLASIPAVILLWLAMLLVGLLFGLSVGGCSMLMEH